jgi:Ca2+-binding EF-hand superfamily protein
LPYYGLSLAWFLAADKGGNLEVSKPELTELLTRRARQEGFKPELTEENLKTLEAEYFGPMADAIIKLADSNGDGNVSRAEADAMDGGPAIDDDEWNKLDTNRDGKISRDELIAGFRVELAEDYKLPEAKEPEHELYRKGRAWVLRTESEEDGRKEVSHVRHEVISVVEGVATLRRTRLDAEEKPVGEPVEYTEEVLKPVEPRGKRETIKVKAGEFECALAETAAEGTVLKAWESVRYSGLTVKSFVQIGGRRTTIELVKFE